MYKPRNWFFVLYSIISSDAWSLEIFIPEPLNSLGITSRSESQFQEETVSSTVYLIPRGWRDKLRQASHTLSAVGSPMKIPSSLLNTVLPLFAFFSCTSALAQSLTQAQIKQIEEIAQKIARQHNDNAAAMLDDMTISTQAVAVARNVRFENILRVRKGLPPAKIREFSEETRREIVPKSCAMNAKNPAFDRGLTYTFAYANTYGEKLAEFTVDKAICSTYN